MDQGAKRPLGGWSVGCQLNNAVDVFMLPLRADGPSVACPP